MSSTPDSVLSRHLSPPKRAVFGLHGVTGPCQHRCDANERHDPNGLPLSLAVARPTHLALHGSAQSPSHEHCCCMLVRFYRTVSALTCAPKKGHRRECLLLSACVNAQLPRHRPCLLFHRVTWPLARSKSREVPLACASDGTHLRGWGG